MPDTTSKDERAAKGLCSSSQKLFKMPYYVRPRRSSASML
jgi:hypothetical protein